MYGVTTKKMHRLSLVTRRHVFKGVALFDLIHWLKLPLREHLWNSTFGTASKASKHILFIHSWQVVSL